MQTGCPCHFCGYIGEGATWLYSVGSVASGIQDSIGILRKIIFSDIYESFTIITNN